MPTKYLVFETRDSEKPWLFSEEKIRFPENHATLLFNGSVYDWYGRKIRNDEDIKRIIEPAGSGIRKTDAYETYIVERKDGRYTVAEVLISSTRIQNITTESHIKSEILGGIMEFGQELKCKTWSFGSRVETPLRMTCFKDFEYGGGNFLILLDVKDELFDKKDSAIVFYPVTEGYIGDIGHFIFKDRESSLDSSDISQRTEYANFLTGKLEFSNNGNKVTAKSPKGYRISTDAEVLKKVGRSMTITWYLDPA